MILPTSAQTVNLYRSVSPSDSIVVSLIGLYRNSTDYNPYDEYFVCRAGEFDYYLFYGTSLQDDYNYIRYYGTQSSSYNQQWQYSTGSGSNLNVNQGIYKGVGNVTDSISSSVAETFKFQYVIVIVAVLISIIVLFKVFRFSFKNRFKTEGWTI